jgi:hypothetical protein
MMRRLVQIAAIGSLLGLPTIAAAESMVDTLLRVAGLTASPAQMRGPGDEAEAGDIWVAGTGGGPAAALTSGSGYRSPVFAPDGSIVALKGDALVRIPPAAAARHRCSARPGW